ncbi:mechanosensitive ion channel family protein [Halomarina oriensis]|uniref:Mechanosensitive ion channel n=1 Tax=Halomarina oriensis TaxID=671145 RepID=A0A6B0GSC9_9EURY|nr:hypothetical protein [Halomarina oriensis]MWG34588.1 hypothetical protein [Halomarina oriensis]
MNGATHVILQVEIPQFLQETVAQTIAFVPNLVGALVVLLIGWVVGRVVRRIVSGVTDRVELDRLVLNTPIGSILGGTEDAVSNAFGTLAAWFVYAVALLAAADVLDVAVLSQWIATVVSYLPAFVAGLLIIVLGFVVADFVGDAIERTRAATRTAYTSWFATGVRLFLYFVVITVGLDTMGVDVTLLTTVATALAIGVAVAIGLGGGLAIGLGGREYVADNVDRWMRRAKHVTPPPDGQSEESTPISD